jgi:hypothetical protein
MAESELGVAAAVPSVGPRTAVDRRERCCGLLPAICACRRLLKRGEQPQVDDEDAPTQPHRVKRQSGKVKRAQQKGRLDAGLKRS